MASSGYASYSISVAVLQEEVRRRRALAIARAILAVLSGLLFAVQVAIVIVGASEVQSAHAFCLQRSGSLPHYWVGLLIYELFVATYILLVTGSAVTLLVPALWPFGDETSQLLHMMNEPTEGVSLTILFTWAESSLSIWKLCDYAKALGGSTELKMMEGTSETDWSFGQILPLVMLLSPVMAAVQALLGMSKPFIGHLLLVQT
jgi:hypothetical protein